MEFIGKLDKRSPWELGGDIFGKYASTAENLSKIKSKRKDEKNPD